MARYRMEPSIATSRTSGRTAMRPSQAFRSTDVEKVIAVIRYKFSAGSAGALPRPPEQSPAGSCVGRGTYIYILKVSYFWYIKMSSTTGDLRASAKRIRLSREQRQRQLLDVAWRLARE